MRIDPAPLVCLNHPCPDTGQVQGGKSQVEPQAFEVVRGGEATGLKLVATRFFVTEGFFNVETQAVLVEGLSISRLGTRDGPGIIGVVKQASQSQGDWPDASSENRHLLEEAHLAGRGTEISDGCNRLGSEMDQGVARQAQEIRATYAA